MNIAFLGIGLMGVHMARNLARADHDVTAWNRTRSKADPLLADAVSIADTAAEAVASAEIVISMLTDGPVTAAVQNDQELRYNLQPGAIWIEMSSVKPAEARAQADDLATLGIRHLDAPVSGGTRGAEAGTLAIMVGGDSAVFDAAKDVLANMGRPVLVGPSGAGELAKLANQAIVAISISAVSEAMLLLEKGGADPAAVRDALKGGFADSTILQQHGKRMSDRDFEPGGLSWVQVKDLDNILAEAGDLDLSLPATEETRARFQTLCTELNGANLDHSALFVELLHRNGLGEAS